MNKNTTTQKVLYTGKDVAALAAIGFTLIMAGKGYIESAKGIPWSKWLFGTQINR